MKTIKPSLIGKAIYFIGGITIAGCAGNIAIEEKMPEKSNLRKNVPIEKSNFKLYSQEGGCKTFIWDKNRDGEADAVVSYCKGNEPIRFDRELTQNHIDWYKKQK